LLQVHSSYCDALPGQALKQKLLNLILSLAKIQNAFEMNGMRSRP
jgi:hypothetical protein